MNNVDLKFIEVEVYTGFLYSSYSLTDLSTSKKLLNINFIVAAEPCQLKFRENVVSGISIRVCDDPERYRDLKIKGNYKSFVKMLRHKGLAEIETEEIL